MRIQLVDVNVAPLRVGYIMGSGDSVPDAIRQLGMSIELLDDEFLKTGDLTQFDTVVVGVRATSVRPAFVAQNSRILEYARAGGTVIVQYQYPDYTALGLAPYSGSISADARVVDESATVTILHPEHAIFSYPNTIIASDFDGWVQERVSYAFSEFDADSYLPLIESSDIGERSVTGSLLYARLGKGHYIYTSLAWFRQLPAGVPGAYRLFANLLSTPQSISPSTSGSTDD
jgi:hypothetical protein